MYFSSWSGSNCFVLVLFINLVTYIIKMSTLYNKHYCYFLHWLLTQYEFLIFHSYCRSFIFWFFFEETSKTLNWNMFSPTWECVKTRYTSVCCLSMCVWERKVCMKWVERKSGCTFLSVVGNASHCLEAESSRQLQKYNHVLHVTSSVSVEGTHTCGNRPFQCLV